MYNLGPESMTYQSVKMPTHLPRVITYHPEGHSSHARTGGLRYAAGMAGGI